MILLPEKRIHSTYFNQKGIYGRCAELPELQGVLEKKISG